MQRDLQGLLQIERATLSGIVSTLVGKGLIEQLCDRSDQRRKELRLTEIGRALWSELPDPIALARSVAFAGVDDADLARTASVLEAATMRLQGHLRGK